MDCGWRSRAPSGDGGATWTEQTTPQNTACINSLAYDALHPATVYAGTAGGLLTSLDGGANWTRPASQPPVDRVGAVVVDPRNSGSVYLCGAASGGWATCSGAYATHNGGITWEMLDGLPDTPIWGMQFVKLGAQQRLYAATGNGLRFLSNVPAGSFDPHRVWEASDGIAGAASLNGFAAAADGLRVVTYIGSGGGALGTSPALGSPAAAGADAQNLGAGVYRSQIKFYLTFLPAISR